MKIRADFHIHTVLSPCAEVEMIPPLIVERALAARLDLIAITDHNASANVGAVIDAAKNAGLKILPGMELQTREHVHLLCLFDTVEQLIMWQSQVDAAMPDMQNRADLFGEQFVVDASGDFMRREERLLLTSADIMLEDAVKRVSDLGGITIPAHIDRPENGLIQILGFVPPNLNVAALEISPNIEDEQARKKFPSCSNYSLIRGSDAHWLDAMASGVTELEIESRDVENVARALREKRFAICKE
jgi:PHP family Zn ribbon phosphoesterase